MTYPTPNYTGITRLDDCETWYTKGKVYHTIWSNGNRYWWGKGRLHNTTGHAVEVCKQRIKTHWLLGTKITNDENILILTYR